MMAPFVVFASWLVVGFAAVGAVRQSGRGASLARAVVDRSSGRSAPEAVDGRVLWSPAGVVEWLSTPFVRRSRQASRRDLIVLIDELSSALASGASPEQAMDEASALPGPLAAGMAGAVRQVRRGRGVQQVLDEWAAAHRDVGAMLLADALALADAAGGSRTRALIGVRSTLREADGLAAEVRTLAAQASLSATVLTLVPVGFAALVAVADQRIASFLFATPMGWACLAGGGALDAVGTWWMHRLTGRLR